MNTRLNIYSYMPTNPENLVKIGLIGVLRSLCSKPLLMKSKESSSAKLMFIAADQTALTVFQERLPTAATQ